MYSSHFVTHSLKHLFLFGVGIKLLSFSLYKPNVKKCRLLERLKPMDLFERLECWLNLELG